MTFLADENFPRPALDALRKAGWDVLSIAEECPGVSDEEVAALCAEQQRILLTFDKDFGELVFPTRAVSGKWSRPISVHTRITRRGRGVGIGIG